MSALPSKAHKQQTFRYVRFMPAADIADGSEFGDTLRQKKIFQKYTTNRQMRIPARSPYPNGPRIV
jgi:hypothetical protein